MIPVIIPHYGKPEQLEKCMEHLARQTTPVETFVYDNNAANIYFTAAVNEGIKKHLHADCDYMMLLNQDMYLRPDAVAELVRFMDANPSCGIAAPLQVSPSDPEEVTCGGGLQAFPAGGHVTGRLSSFTGNRETHWANGACMMLRRTMIEEIGLLDKNMALICSDSDYCFTARSRGWRIWVVAAAVGVHDHGVTSNTSNPEMELVKINDILHFADKWLTGGLYQRLSLEGGVLTPEFLSDTLASLQRAKDALLAARGR